MERSKQQRKLFGSLFIVTRGAKLLQPTNACFQSSIHVTSWDFQSGLGTQINDDWMVVRNILTRRRELGHVNHISKRWNGPTAVAAAFLVPDAEELAGEVSS